MIQKTELRRHWLHVRKSIPSERRNKGSKDLLSSLQPLLKGPVLSFSSFGSEIETTSLNLWLASQKILLLPRVGEKGLTIHLVKDLFSDLVPSKRGMLEPNPEKCPQVDIRSIEAVLVPGLAFDNFQNRLGYGQGHYDRLIPQLSCPSMGIAFHEQMAKSLPCDPWDCPVQKVMYF